MKWTVLIALCLLFVPPAFSQEVTPTDSVAAADVAAPAPAEAPDAETPAPAAADAPAPAEPVVAVADATPETIVIPVVDPAEDPSTGDEVVAAAEKVKQAWYEKNYPALAGAIIFLILTLFRLPLFGSLLQKIPQRYRILIAVALSFAAAFLQIVALGTPWDIAMINILGTGSTAVFANELIVESLMGKRYKKAESKS